MIFLTRRGVQVNECGNPPKQMLKDIQSCAKGNYQESLLGGWSKWSGADLQGKARNWGTSYRRSRSNLLGRITKVCSRYGWYADTQYTGPRGKVELVVLSPSNKTGFIFGKSK